MTDNKLSKEYIQWIEDERAIADQAYIEFRAGKQEGKKAGSRFKGKSIKMESRTFFLRIAAAAVLVLALGFSIWIKRDDIFKPNYSEEQIALSYEHAVKSLAVCANSLSNEINKLQKLGEISKSLENINKLENVINN